MAKKAVWTLCAFSFLFAVMLSVSRVNLKSLQASDHDDGATDVKALNTNLTDVYVYREIDQQATKSATDLILTMTVNPRSIPRQNYFFNTVARYDFHVTRITSNNSTPTGKDDVIVRFTFGSPDTNNRQKITVTLVKDGAETSVNTTTAGGDILTTAIADADKGATATTDTTNTISLGGQTLAVFAGLREDPFFFDVQQFFKVRAGQAAAFNNPGTDYFSGFNLLAIVARVPRALLQSASSETTFDTWASVSVPTTLAAKVKEY